MEYENKQIAEESVAEEPVAINPATVTPLVVDPVTITSSHAKKWYDTGFEFAVNYIYAKLEYWDSEFTQTEFKMFCDIRLGNVIDEKYMETYNFYKDPEIITSPQARKWYDFGFIFAVNYIHAWLVILANPKLTPAKFKMFCDNRFVNVIDLTYFERFPFYYNSAGDNPYGAGQCPGDLPNTCIPCINPTISPFRR